MFQSTRPVWAATIAINRSVHQVEFQSTRPVWAATDQASKSVPRTPVSIHAARVGRDKSEKLKGAGTSSVSIHAARVGRDRKSAMFTAL